MTGNNGVLNQLAEDEVVPAHLLGARALIAGVLLRRRTRLFRFGVSAAAAAACPQPCAEFPRGSPLLLGCGCKILCVRADRVHRTAAAQLPLNTRLQMPQCVCGNAFRSPRPSVSGAHRPRTPTFGGRADPLADGMRYAMSSYSDLMYFVRQLTRHVVARLDHHAVKTVGVRDLLFHPGDHLAADNPCSPSSTTITVLLSPKC